MNRLDKTTVIRSIKSRDGMQDVALAKWRNTAYPVRKDKGRKPGTFSWGIILYIFFFCPSEYFYVSSYLFICIKYNTALYFSD